MCVLDPAVMMVEKSIRLSAQGLRCIELVKDKLLVGGSDNHIRVVNPLSLDTEKFCIMPTAIRYLLCGLTDSQFYIQVEGMRF